MNLYNSAQQCTELFSRVGTEYIPQLFTGKISLDNSKKESIGRLVDIYDDYFEISYTANTEKYWNSINQLDAFEEKIINYSNTLDSKRDSAQTLINYYYAWPTWSRYNSANNSITEYNNMVSVFNSYVETYNKIYGRLDSERVLSSGIFLDL